MLANSSLFLESKLRPPEIFQIFGIIYWNFPILVLSLPDLNIKNLNAIQIFKALQPRKVCGREKRIS